jgi:nucleoid DNA-binding protein
MTKTEIIKRIYENTGIKKQDVEEVVECLFAEIKSAAIKKKSTYVRGFGTFDLVKRKAKVGQNISTGESIMIPERHTLKLRICSTLLKEINNGYQR